MGMTPTHRLLAMLSMVSGIALATVSTYRNDPVNAWCFYAGGFLMAVVFAHKRPDIDFD
jgi:hypothetical protein